MSGDRPVSIPSRWRRMVLPFFLVLVVVAIVGVRLMNERGSSPTELGVTDGGLAQCPNSPNCVSSTATDPKQVMEPIPWSGTPTEGLDRLESIVRELPRTRIVQREENYLRVEFRSWLFGFVDDVEFLVPRDEGVIHFRSASRVGYSDMGVNRKRMTGIGQRFDALK